MFYKKRFSSLVLSTASLLVLSACGGSSASDLTAESLEAALNVDIRSVSDADATEVLSAMGMSDAASGPFDWENMTMSNGVASFTDWGDDDAFLIADKITFSGLHMDGGSPSFDLVEIEGLSVELEEETQFGYMTTNVDKVVLANPDKAAADSFISSISEGNGFVAMSGHGFEAGMFSNMTMILDDDFEYGSVYKMVFGPGSSDDTVNIVVIGQAMDMGELMGGMGGMGPSMDMSMTVASNKTLNANADYLKEMSKMMSGASTPSQNMLKNLGYEAHVMEDFKMVGDGMKISIPKIETQASKSGSVMSATSTIDLSTIEIEGMEEMGLGVMTFDGVMDVSLDADKDNVNIERIYLDFKDQFQLNMAFDMDGYLKFMEAMEVADPNDYQAMNRLTEENMFDINYIKMQFTDNSIMDKVWAFAAEQQGGNPKLIRQQAKAGLAMAGMMAETPEQRKMIASMTGAVSEFIDNNGTLTFEMKPEDGFSFADIQSMDDPNEALEKLGLSLTHSK